MSGFAGVIRLDDRPSDATHAKLLLRAVQHRGPDAQGQWSDAAAVLVHASLRTTPESEFESQPLTHARSGNTLVGDLRLDNRDELIRALNLAHQQNPMTDAALVLHAYEKWAHRCATHIEGDFAFAVWNPREREIFCARDPFGVKPLLYSLVPGKLFAFASELRGLLALTETSRELDERRIADFIAVYFDDTQRTFYRAAHRLPGGHTLCVKHGASRVEPQRYWSMRDVKPLRLANDAEYAAAFREQFARAVHRRMRVCDSSKIASMLSGGLDSSAISCFARSEIAARGGAPLDVISWVFSDALDADEREYQELVAASGGMRRHVLDTAQTAYSPWTDIESFMPNGPLYAPNFYINYGAAKLARKLGSKVILEGLGGDSTISQGSARFGELLWTGRWSTLLRELRLYAQHSEDTTIAQLLLAHGIRPAIPTAVLELVRRLRGQSLEQSALSLLSPQSAKLSSITHATTQKLALTTRQAHLFDFQSPLLAEGLELVDRVMAMGGAEGRYPFFDRQLAEFCLSLPSDQKLANGYSRSILRRGMDGILPATIQWRASKGKPGFHIIPALRAQRERLDQLFLHDPSLISPYVNIDELRSVYLKFANGQPTPFVTVVRLWSIAVLGVWLRTIR